MPAPDVTESEDIRHFRTLRLEPLVRMKLTSFRDKDRMHLRDMIDVQLVDASRCTRFPPEPSARLKELLDRPEGGEQRAKGGERRPGSRGVPECWGRVSMRLPSHHSTTPCSACSDL